MRGLTCSRASFSLNRTLKPSEVVRILTVNPLTFNSCPIAVHILSGDLILHKRTLGPVKSLIYSLWHYDVDRTAACLDVPASESEKVAGYMSHKAKIYLVCPFFQSTCGFIYSPDRLMCTTILSMLCQAWTCIQPWQKTWLTIPSMYVMTPFSQWLGTK